MKYARRILEGIILAGAAVTVLLVSQLFFQQDEWHSFGVILGYGTRYMTLGKSLWQLILSDRFGARLLMYGLFSVFGVNSLPFGILAGSLHAINSWLVYLVAKKLTRDKLIALLSSLFFLVNAVSHQAYSWFGTVAGSTTSVTFIILSMLLFLTFIENGSRRLGWLSILTLWVSFLFKETGYFLFLWYPALWLLMRQKKFSSVQFVKDLVPLGLLGLLMTSIFLKAVLTIPGDRANYIAPTTGGLTQAATNGLRYAVEGSAQVFLPAPVVFETARSMTSRFIPWLMPNTPSFDLFYTTTMAEIVSLGFALLLFVFLVKIYKTTLATKPTPMNRAFFASLIFLPLSFIPYIVLNRFDAYLDSRYYYAPAVGASLLFGIIAGALVQKAKQERIATVLVLVVFLIFHTTILVGDLTSQIRTGNERRKILATIRSSVPTLPAKAVFFISGNSDGFYALPELKVPFQSGLGHVLMVLYAADAQLPKDFFTEQTLGQALDVGFLYDTVAQGYKEIDGRGFGYFYDKKAMKDTLDAHQRKDITIFPFFYDADIKQLRRISL